MAIRYAPLLDMVLSLLVLQNPERFGTPEAWMARVRGRVPAQAWEQLLTAAESDDLFALALELDETALPVPDAIHRIGEQKPALAAALLSYWEAVAPEVAAQAGVVAESMQVEMRNLAAMDPAAFMCRFSDRISVVGDGEAIMLQWGKGMRVPLADLRRILFVPSGFSARRLMFYRLGAVQVFFYQPRRELPAQVADAPESLMLGFSALADGTRLKLLRLIASAGVPAQEMARRLGLNDSTVSRHLRLLVEAGLVYRDRQEGKTIYYGFRAERLDQLATGARGYLERE